MRQDRRPVLNDFVVLRLAAHHRCEIRRKIRLIGSERRTAGVEIIQRQIAVEVDFDILSADDPGEHQVGCSFLNDHNLAVKRICLQQFSERIDRFPGTCLSERGGVLRRAAVKSVDTNKIMVIALKNRLKIVLAANERRIKRNHRRKGPVQCKQRVPFSVVEIAGKRFQKLRFHLHRQIVHHHAALQIGRHQPELLRLLLKFLQIPVPDMDQIFRFKRHIFSRTHPVNHFSKRIDFGTIGNRRGIGFQITLCRSLARFQLLNGLGLVQRTQIHRDRKIRHVCLQQDIAVKRRQVEPRKLPHDQNVVIHSVTVHPVMPLGGGFTFPVLLHMILPAELIPVNIAEIRTENFPVINLFRRKRLVHRTEKFGKQFKCRKFMNRKTECAFQK